MKILKYVGLAILSIIIIVLIAGVILPNKFHASSEIEINQPVSNVYEYVRHLKNQPYYDPWSSQDPNIERTYKGTDGEVGFIYQWKSDKVGNGKQIIKKLYPNKKVEMEIFLNDSKQPAYTYYEFSEIDANRTKVKWAIDGVMPYPFNVVNAFYDMNEDFDKGLQNLKSILERTSTNP